MAVNLPKIWSESVSETLTGKDLNDNFSALANAAFVDQSALAAASGVATLDANSKLVQDAKTLGGVGLDGLLQAAPKKNVAVVGGVIRNSGSGWNLITATGHDSVNIDSVTNDTSVITVNYSNLGATNVVTFVAVPDETFAEKGLMVGTSVGTAATTITLAQSLQMGGYVAWGGTEWDVSLAPGMTASAFSNGVLTLTYDEILGDFTFSATGRGGTLIPQIGSAGSTSLDLSFYDWSGTLQTTRIDDMRAWIHVSGFGTIDPSGLVSASGNIWLFGVFEV